MLSNQQVPAQTSVVDLLQRYAGELSNVEQMINALEDAGYVIVPIEADPLVTVALTLQERLLAIHERVEEQTSLINEVYRERARVIATLAASFPSVISFNDPDCPEFGVLYIELPTGQVTWHISDTDLDLFPHVLQVPAADPRAHWDGHTTAEKNLRLEALIATKKEKA